LKRPPPTGSIPFTQFPSYFLEFLSRSFSLFWLTFVVAQPSSI
jgi:hypothetical protein